MFSVIFFFAVGDMIVWFVYPGEAAAEILAQRPDMVV